MTKHHKILNGWAHVVISVCFYSLGFCLPSRIVQLSGFEVGDFGLVTGAVEPVVQFAPVRHLVPSAFSFLMAKNTAWSLNPTNVKSVEVCCPV